MRPIASVSGCQCGGCLGCVVSAPCGAAPPGVPTHGLDWRRAPKGSGGPFGFAQGRQSNPTASRRQPGGSGHAT